MRDSSSRLTADISRHPADEAQTAIATFCRFLPYAVRLRDIFAGRNSHDVYTIRRAMNYEKVEVLSGTFITPAEGLHYPERRHAHALPTPALGSA